MKLMKICDMKTLRNILEQGPNFGNSKPIVVDPNIDTDTEEGSFLDNIIPGGGIAGRDTDGGEDSFLDNILAGRVTDGGGNLFGPNNERKVTDPRYGWTIKKRSDNETMMSNYAEAIQSAINATSEDDAILDSITIEELDGGGERLVLTGQTKKGKHHLYPIEKKGSEWGWVDDADHDGNVLPDSEHKWYKFSQY